MYCKCISFAGFHSCKVSINSSKVYCKLLFTALSPFITVVLIVAKCIVNVTVGGTYESQFGVLIVAKCIVNSFIISVLIYFILVLIVAKCIVNFLDELEIQLVDVVLIVAKCIVNWCIICTIRL